MPLAARPPTKRNAVHPGLCASQLSGSLRGTVPRQFGAGRVVALDAGFAFLTAHDSGQLFRRTIKRLDLTAETVTIVCDPLSRTALSNFLREAGVEAAVRC